MVVTGARLGAIEVLQPEVLDLRSDLFALPLGRLADSECLSLDQSGCGKSLKVSATMKQDHYATTPFLFERHQLCDSRCRSLLNHSIVRLQRAFELTLQIYEGSECNVQPPEF